MAANKFATMLHKNTNRITFILVYTLLEWILIVLLLLNSLFSYLIIKFADYFGLKRPCLWCTRLDHIFEPSKHMNSFRDLVCDDHANEISKLGYCSNHRKLAESQDMCEDCLSSSRSDCCDLSKKLALFPCMKQVGLIQDGGDKVIENGEENFKCSCCGVMLEKKWNFPYLLIRPSWEVLDYPQKGNLITEAGGADDFADEGHASDGIRSDFVADYQEDEQRIEENNRVQIISDGGGEGVKGSELEKEEDFSCFISSFDCNQMAANEDDVVIQKDQVSMKEEGNLNVSMDGQLLTQVACRDDESPEILPKHLEFYIEGDDCHLIPVELMDSIAVESQRIYTFREEDQGISGNGDVILDFDLHAGTLVELNVENRCSSGEKVALLSAHESEDETSVAVVESVEPNERKESFSMHAGEEDEQVASTQATPASLNESDVRRNAATGEREMDEDVNQVSDEQNDEIEAEISIGKDILDHEPIEDFQMQHLYDCTQEDPTTSSAQLHADADQDYKNAEEETIQFKTLTVETFDEAIKSHLSLSSELNEIEEDKVPDTPSSIDSLHLLHKKLLLLDRRESGTEDSLDGSVFSDIEGADGILTVEKLKSALKAERKALNALYTELEEERSASAVAANQTMAMINRLQEEKAAMQMEALQYQRMMEEQSEYDQEALQLLNELMVKREKEKAELEKELEIYRRKVQDYEAKEKMIMLRRRKDDSTRSATSTSCSNAEDSDGLSVDLNHEPKEEDSFDNRQEDCNQNTPADAVLYLEESLANFEEERQSILEQLKVLEEKLVSLNDEDEQHFEDIKSVEYLYEENGNGFHESSDFSYETNGVANSHFKRVNGKHDQEKKLMAAKSKRLLPLFDATDAEIEDGILNGHENGFDSVALQHSSPANSELEYKKLAIEEEVDYVYERLQALEADREFLKHCISSLRKGDKGIYLLQEILQHLRDLRSVEFRVRSIGDAAM
ncbi:myosin-binding protein 2-like [Durio zibethinus]|uniref:Myosin-binding protein 2-like n=1 Tax=Durio zibethinus TaxID=66656 RepID=A0A6P5XC55_DURZI|nr:myosin-binding protein 2-like [Durio zibethinus]XP_022725950.1 myosin-binding protein 2-like [Durio zibethinus]